MRIALDFDDTYTKDEAFWDAFLELADSYEHDVRIVTHRHPELDRIVPPFGNKTYYTNGVAKRYWLEANTDWMPDVWVDDQPEGIKENSDKSEEWLAEWRATREG